MTKEEYKKKIDDTEYSLFMLYENYKHVMGVLGDIKEILNKYEEGYDKRLRDAVERDLKNEK